MVSGYPPDRQSIDLPVFDCERTLKHGLQLRIRNMLHNGIQPREAICEHVSTIVSLKPEEHLILLSPLEHVESLSKHQLRDDITSEKR